MLNWLRKKKDDKEINDNELFLLKDFIIPELKKIDFTTYQPELFQIIKSFVKEETYILPNQPLFLIRNFEEYHIVSLPFGGYVKKIFTIGNHLNLNHKFIEIEKIEDMEHLETCHFENYKYKLIQTDINLQYDEFTNEKSISFSKVSGEETNYFKLYSSNVNSLDWFGLTIENNDGFEYLLFHLNSDLMTLGKGDQIIFLFENKIKFEIEIEQILKHSTAIYSLSNEILQTLIENKIEKVKVIDNKSGCFQIFIPQVQFNELIPVLYDDDKQYLLKSEAYFLLDFMLNEFNQINIKNKNLK
jgi:hypothetical protein